MAGFCFYISCESYVINEHFLHATCECHVITGHCFHVTCESIVVTRICVHVTCESYAVIVLLLLVNPLKLIHPVEMGGKIH